MECFYCKKDIEQKHLGEKCFSCDGCRKAMCERCSTGTFAATEIRVLQLRKDRKLTYFCVGCKKDLKEKKEFEKKILDVVQETIRKYVTDIKEEIGEMVKGKIEEAMKGGSENTYADRLKMSKEEVIVVKPKKASQSSDVTKNACKEKLNPIEMKVGIEKLRKIRDGGVVIACSSKDEINKVDAEVRKKMGDEYVVTVPVTRNPRIRIKGVEEEMSDEEIVDCLKNQNPEAIKEDATIEVTLNKKLNKVYMVVISVDAQTFNRVMEEKRLKLNWQRCQISEYLGITRCFKCYSYEHRSAECERGLQCSKCGGKHKANDCEAEECKCSNCCEMNDRLNLKLDVRHSVLSEECPVYKRKLSMKKRAVNYESM